MAGTIAVIDDCPQYRQLVATALWGAGYEVIEAASCDDLVVALETFKVDLVISDLYMPDADGIEVTRLLRSRWPKLRVLVISAQFDHCPPAERVLQVMGVDGLLTKFADPAELVALAGEIVARGPRAVLHAV